MQVQHMRFFRAATAECPSTFQVYNHMFCAPQISGEPNCLLVWHAVIKWKNIISDTGLNRLCPPWAIISLTGNVWPGRNKGNHLAHPFWPASVIWAYIRAGFSVYTRLCSNWRQWWDFLTQDVSRRYLSVSDSWHFPAWRGEAPKDRSNSNTIIPVPCGHHWHHLFKQNLWFLNAWWSWMA